MSLKSIKALVARLHSDDGLRSRFAADPDSVMSEFKLTAPEKASLKTAHLRIGADGTLAVDEEGPTSWWVP